VHDTLLALEVLLADGSIVSCTPENEHRDLFFGFPNSYGTLGYALKVTARTEPVKSAVRIEHVRHTDPLRYFEELAARCRTKDADFIDGTVFSGDEMYITLGRFADSAPYTSDYTFEHIYYRSIREKKTDCSPQKTSSGAGTPIGSGARKTSSRRTRWSAGSWGANASTRPPTRK